MKVLGLKAVATYTHCPAANVPLVPFIAPVKGVAAELKENTAPDEPTLGDPV